MIPTQDLFRKFPVIPESAVMHSALNRRLSYAAGACDVRVWSGGVPLSPQAFPRGRKLPANDFLQFGIDSRLIRKFITVSLPALVGKIENHK